MLLTPERTLTIPEALNWRYATKAFDPDKKISLADWNLIKQSLALAPSSFGLQPWKFIVVQDPDLRKSLREVSRAQAQVTDAAQFVVLASLKSLDAAYISHYVARIAEVRRMSPESLDAVRQSVVEAMVKGPRSATIPAWSQRQTYLALGFAMLTAAQLGIDSCPMESFDHPAYDRLLGLEKSDYASIAALPLGYRLESDKQSHLAKVRFKEEELFETR